MDLRFLISGQKCAIAKAKKLWSGLVSDNFCTVGDILPRAQMGDLLAIDIAEAHLHTRCGNRRGVGQGDKKFVAVSEIDVHEFARPGDAMPPVFLKEFCSNILGQGAWRAEKCIEFFKGYAGNRGYLFSGMAVFLVPRIGVKQEPNDDDNRENTLGPAQRVRVGWHTADNAVESLDFRLPSVLGRR